MIGKKVLYKLTNLIGEILFPPRCYFCDTKVHHWLISAGLCKHCFASVPYIREPQCLICGRNFLPGQQDHFCERCIRYPPPFALARGITYYEEPIRALLHSLKYSFDTTAVAPLLEIAQSFDISEFESCDLYIPVPLHRRKLKKRGVNHALLLARILFHHRKSSIVPGILVKKRHTPSQTGLNREGRKRNVAGAFFVKHPEIIRKKSICLIDDIFTTGATVTECAATLLSAGAYEVKVLTFARVRELK